MATVTDEKRIDWTAYWLVKLERAVSGGDYSAAVEAQTELRRLGLDASLRIIQSQRGVTHAR